ncbi:hypothetical protein B0H13DRAFT_2668458 [Mycena leptocephala]|nr:hypothetical protein B0H13DRAFT_2668458 [Mycena leptocephala]
MRVLHLVPSLILSCACSVSAAKNSKHGLAYAEADRPTDIVVANQPASVLSWVYDWGTARPFITSSQPHTVVAQGAKTILAFNEPDFASQSNVPPAQGEHRAVLHHPLHSKGIKLGAPAVTNTPSGALWLSAFLAACTNCTMSSSQYIVVLNFLKQSEASFDSFDWIQGYSWFAFFQKETGSNYNLLDVNGQLTALGQAYVNNVV